MSDALLVRSFQNLPDLNVWRKSSLSIFAFKLTCWLANGQTAWWTSIKTQWQSHSFWKSRYEVIWVLCHGRSADRSVCTAFAAMPSRIQGHLKTNDVVRHQLVWNGLKSRNQNVKRQKKYVPYFIAGPHRWRFLVRSTHSNIGQKCQGRISAWQSSLVELRPVSISI